VTHASQRRPPTITDVARLADVSITTVSFVLNDAADRSIPDETRNRVRAAAEQLGYRPNAAAKLLRTRRSHTIGFITDEVATTPFAGEIIRGAQEAAWALGKVLIIVNTDGNEAIRDSAIEMMLERRVEGLIFATTSHQAVTLPTTHREAPVVLLNCFVGDRSLPSVVPDEVGGGCMATDVLVRKGHRRIGFINLYPCPAADGRLEGYVQTLRSHDLPVDAALIRATSDRVPGMGYRRALELFDVVDPPTALFCGNDRTAMEAYDAIKERGKRIPADVAVVGFDNQEIIAEHLRPRLSTVALPHGQMGRWAIDYLIQSADHAENPPLQHTIPCPYVGRASV
jgi:LacI family transcriptional regulator